MTTVWFGKYKNKPISEVPDGYLEWVIDNIDNDKIIKSFKIEKDRRANVTTKQYLIVKSDEDYKDMLNHIQSYEMLSFDVETTGLNTRKDKVIGFSVSGKEGVAFYLPLWTYNKNKSALEAASNTKESAKKLLEILKTKKLIMWNGSFDIRMSISNFNIDLTESLYIEGMLLKHTLQEDGPFGLKETGIELQQHIGLNVEEEANKEQIELKKNIEENGGSATKVNYEMYKADLDILGIYACADADLTLRIVNYYLEKLKEEELEDFFFNKEVMPLYKEVTIPMEMKPVKLDMELIQSAKVDIEKDIVHLEKCVKEELFKLEEFTAWYTSSIAKSVKATPSGAFAQELIEYYDIDLPKTKAGKYSTSKSAIDKLNDSDVKRFLQGDLDAINNDSIMIISEKVFLKKSDGVKINISSKKQMGELVFDYIGETPLAYTKKKAPKFDSDLVDHLASKGYSWAKHLKDYNRLIKIRGAYIDRFLDGNEDGNYYFSYKQHGTISGRYGSDAQQLPRPMEDDQDSKVVLKYNNIIRKFFISGQDRVFVDCDYESLEPHVFAHVSGDDGLREIFKKGHDFYSTIAIATEGMREMSADKKADNYLGKLDKQKRQFAKAYSLGVPYGMGAYALGKTLEIETEEAEVLIDNYLNSYPKLKYWMEESKKKVQRIGYVKSESGRVRHLQVGKELYSKYKENLMDFKFRKSLLKKFELEKITSMYKDYKNAINNGRNFQIQSLSASIVNKAAIEINRWFKEEEIDGWVCAQIHDQLIMNVPERYKDYAAKNIRRIMETSTKLSLQLKAPPSFAYNWCDGH